MWLKKLLNNSLVELDYLSINNIYTQLLLYYIYFGDKN